MRKKRFTLVLAFFVLLMAGCSKTATYTPTPASENSGPSSSSDRGSSSSTGMEDSAKKPLTDAHGTPVELNFDKIEGDILYIHYADGDDVIVAADKLYLYDLKAGRIATEAPRESFDQERYQSIGDGYAAIGATNSADGSPSDGFFLVTDSFEMKYRAVFYDRELRKESTFDFNSLLNEGEVILSLKSIALTADGTQAAFATANGLYLYNFKTKEKSTVLDFNEQDAKALSGIVFVEQIGFTNEDRTLAFKAQSFDVPAVLGKPSFDTCGTVDLDRSSLTNHTFDNYICKELTAYNERLFLAEDFSIPSGRVLIMDVPSGATKLHALTEKGESGFISGSDSGRHFATTLDDQSGWKVRVYDTDTGKLLMDQHISADGEARYMANDPIVKINDHTRTCLVLVGARQPEVPTKVVVSRF